MLLKSIFILYATVLILFFKKPTPNSIFIIGIAVNRKDQLVFTRLLQEKITSGKPDLKLFQNKSKANQEEKNNNRKKGNKK